MTKFIDITLPEPLQRAAADLNYEHPTPIQDQTIEWLLENDTDLIALAQTGTGKTAAFGFPILSQTDIEKPFVQTIILCPTRELCIQITKDMQSYAKYMPRIRITAVYGGAPMQKQKDALKAGVQIVVGTPGRVADMIRQGVLKLEHINRLILDEADEMLNMGFKEELSEIMSHTPAEKQTMLFSATMPKEVRGLANAFMKDPHRISVGNQDQGAENIQHFFYRVQARDKYLALKRIADMSPNIYGIIFCRTRNETQEIADKLQHDGYNADALHGDLSQGQRELVMSRFRSKYVRLLVATDVAARGLDVDDLTHIINFNAPTEPDIYIHRSGRTGRAGKSGISLTIIHSKEIALLKAMERRLGREIVYSKVPGGREICEKQLFHFIDTVERIEVDNAQIDSFLPNVYKKLSWLSREELIQRFVSVEFNRFLTYYKDTKEIDHSGESTPRKEKADVEFKTFRLGIGYVSQVTKRDLMRYINQLKVSRSIEIGQIDILSDHTLVDLDAEYEEQLLKAFSRNKYQGIPVAAEVVDAPRRKRSGSYESKPRDSKPRDYKPRDDKPREFKPRDNKAREFKPREYSGKKTYKKDK
ncbi:MAG: DEAD/DEAH box helicase [Candidatus Cloacimonadaceae bacterium]|nr:DEAD/DEAH box helicase [Candidatus Cloacimonadaceae bacterium]